MSRWWTELVADIGSVVSLPLLIVLLLVAASIVAALWYWFPAWVPRHLPRLRRIRWTPRRWPRWRLHWPRWRWLRWRRRSRRTAVPPVEIETAAEVPELPASEFTSLADRLAAQGRYAEAVRERLRAMVRHLVERGLLEHRPAWTVLELVAAAAASPAPGSAQPLSEAGRIFSEIWYGQRPATADHDARMRELAARLTDAFAPVKAGIS
jgi:hypothetical protein